MAKGRLGDGAVADARQFRDADAQIAVGAAWQRFVEQAGFEQHAQPADQVAGLNSGISCKEARHVERPWRNDQARLGALLDPPEPRRDHVEVAALGDRQTSLQVVGIPAVVVVQDRDVDPPGVAAGPQQVIQAGVPRPGRALRAPVAQEVHGDACRPPVPDQPFGPPGGGIIIARVVDDDDP